jgi:hypothetical protein
MKKLRDSGRFSRRGRFLALCSFANGIHIGQILRTARRKLGCHEVFGGDERRRKATFRIDHAFHTPLPCGLKIDAGDVGKNIEATWIASETKEIAALCEILREDTLKCCSEFGEGRIGRLRIGRVRLCEKVEVPRKAGLRVKNDGVTSDDEVLNAMGTEGGQKIFVVLVHPALPPNL